MKQDYIDAPGCIFVTPIEFDKIEQDLDPVLRAHYSETAFPRTQPLEDHFTYAYLPVVINDKKYKLIAAPRPRL